MTSTARSIESLTTAQTSQDRVLDELLIRGGSPQQVGEDHHVDDHHGRHVENGKVVRDAEIGGIDVILERRDVGVDQVEQSDDILKSQTIGAAAAFSPPPATTFAA